MRKLLLAGFVALSLFSVYKYSLWTIAWLARPIFSLEHIESQTVAYVVTRDGEYLKMEFPFTFISDSHFASCLEEMARHNTYSETVDACFADNYGPHIQDKVHVSTLGSHIGRNN